MNTAEDADRRTVVPLAIYPWWILLLLLQTSIGVFLLAHCGGPGTELWSPGGLLPGVVELSGAGRTRVAPTLLALGLLAEELLFLVGCWSLSKHHLSSPYAVFFVCVSALGSAIALDPRGLSLHAVYALPLLLSFLHGALDDGSRGKLLLAGNLAVLQSLGSPSGASFAAPMVALLYFAGVEFVFRQPIRQRLKALGWRKGDPLVIILLLVLWLPALLAALPRAGVPGAGMESSHPRPEDILLAAGLLHPVRFLDFLIGAPPGLGGFLYCGPLTLGFALVALRTGPRTMMLRLAVAVPAGLLVLGVGLFLAALFNRSQPAPVGMPLVRLMLIFLAGVGVERTLSERRAGPLRTAGWSLLLASILLGFASLGAVANTGTAPAGLLALLGGEPGPLLPPGLVQTDPSSRILGPFPLPDSLGASSLFAGLAGVLLLAWGISPRAAPILLFLILVLHPLDLYSWKFRMLWLESLAARPPATARVSGNGVPPRIQNRGSVESEAALGMTGPPPEPRSLGLLRTGSVCLVGLSALGWIAWSLRTVSLPGIRRGRSP